ncbi:amidohydrolase family protein [Falsiroseomonas selenitidurans]|uniref:Amidohydrolase family protein n=1 Tax=Falsiroseomonas selenitidurans TaxID=2716335 RepID=A0ABX1E263_9PROT|nr:amidohydrolase family protein [Falsiroseomonas selenitidurans]NKC31247.1 amidohydrolase family protein [Falsiroseomonas selenitidurans]
MIDAPLVDTHFHLYTADMPLIGTAWHHPPADATTEDFIATMDAHGVGFGVIAAASLNGSYHDYTLRALRRHRRFRATINALPELDFHTLERMKAEGVVGMRFVLSRAPAMPDLRSPEYRRLLKRAADLDWHVQLLDNSPRLPATIETLEGYGVRLVIDHLGKPDPVAGVNCPGFRAVLAAVERGRTWVKLSAGFRMASPEAARGYAQALVRVAGGARLLWGSDWPFAAFEDRVTYADTLAAFHDWVPDPLLRAQIGGDTPMRLYFRD